MQHGSSLPPFNAWRLLCPNPLGRSCTRLRYLELDPEKVNDRVKAVRRAVYQRLIEDEAITQEEREKINDALRKLYLLTGGSGSA
jgi:hypothetical protein